MKPDWILNATRHKGALHKALNIPQHQKIPRDVLEKKALGSGLMAKRARLALTLRGLGK